MKIWKRGYWFNQGIKWDEQRVWVYKGDEVYVIKGMA